jgi:ABC-2 type transport system permease protein
MTATLTPPPAATAGKVTQVRVLRSEWIKFRTLRSTFFTLVAAVVVMVGFGLLISWGLASHLADRGVRHLDTDPRIMAQTFPLEGYGFAQLAVGVLGVMVISGEYSTGMIRASMSAVPRRLPVLWAKAAVFSVVVLVLMTVTSFVTFFGGEAILSSQHVQATLSSPGELRIVFGTALYLTVVGLLAVGLGALIRNTAGAIAALFGVLLVLPVLGRVLDLTSWGKDVPKYLPSNAGQALLAVTPDPGGLGPWTGFGFFCAYTAAVMVAAAVLLKRRDA